MALKIESKEMHPIFVFAKCCWQWRLVVKMTGRAAKFHLWLNIKDCHPGCFYN